MLFTERQLTIARDIVLSSGSDYCVKHICKDCKYYSKGGYCDLLVTLETLGKLIKECQDREVRWQYGIANELKDDII